MGAMASQITSLTIVYSTLYSGADDRKHQSSASLAFVWGIHRGPVNSPHKWPVTRKMFPFDDVIMNQFIDVHIHYLTPMTNLLKGKDKTNLSNGKFRQDMECISLLDIMFFADEKKVPLISVSQQVLFHIPYHETYISFCFHNLIKQKNYKTPHKNCCLWFDKISVYKWVCIP